MRRQTLVTRVCPGKHAGVRRWRWLALLAVALPLLFQADAPAASSSPTVHRQLVARASNAAPDTGAMRPRYGANLPLAFVANAGQHDRMVRFSAQTGGASFWFTPTEAVFAFAGKPNAHVLRLAFVGANREVRLDGGRPGAGTVNYLRGSDPREWRTGLPTYGEIVYRDLWPGIDLVFRGGEGALKYEFHVAPGARPSDIRLAYRGADRLTLGPAGDLRIHTTRGALDDTRPVTYQAIAGQRVPVDSRFVLDGPLSYGFDVAAYDSRHPLVIDPGIVYSTYLGGTGDDATYGIAVDMFGNAYTTGFTFSADFPTTAGAFDTTFNGGDTDAFVTKLDATGSMLVYSTYLGGSGLDSGYGIAVDAAGNAYVTGDTASADFPTTPGAFDTTYNGGVDAGDAFVTKLNTTGSMLVYSTFLGGSADDYAVISVAVDAAENAYVAGYTNSDNFPTTVGAYDTSHNGGFDGFVTKLDTTGSLLIYSTYLGGTGDDDEALGLAIDEGGNAFVTGYTNSADFPTTVGAYDTTYNDNFDGFVTKLNAAGSGLVYSTYLGGSDFELGNGIAVDEAGSAYVAGLTFSIDFPTTPGAFDVSLDTADGFMTKLNAAGSAPVYSTYFGGSDFDYGSTIAVDAAGSAYVTGATSSADFPTTPGTHDASLDGGSDAHMIQLDPAGSALVYSTYLGGSGDDFGVGIAVDAPGSAYVSGQTGSLDFPTTPLASDMTLDGPSDGYVTKLETVIAPASTDGEVKGHGHIIGPSVGKKNKINFGLRAKSTDTEIIKDRCKVHDHALDKKIRCVDVDTLTITGDTATLTGDAMEDGVATTYTIEVTDNSKKGKGNDTFSIQTGTGYTRGGVLAGGNIHIKD